MNSTQKTEDEIDVTYSKKKNLQNNIHKLKNKKYYKYIYDFILKNNINHSKNSNGIFFNLNNLTKTQFENLNQMTISYMKILNLNMSPI